MNNAVFTVLIVLFILGAFGAGWGFCFCHFKHKYDEAAAGLERMENDLIAREANLRRMEALLPAQA